MGVVLSFQPKTGLGFLDAIATKVAATAKLWLGERDSDANTSELKAIDLKAMKLLITWSLAAPFLVFALAAQLLTIPTAIALALSTSGIFMLSCGIYSKQKDIKNAGILAVIGSAIVISVLVSVSGQAAMQMAMLYFVIPAEVYLITKQRQSVIAATFASFVLGACAVIIASVGANELAHSTLLGATIIVMLLGYGFARVFHNDNASMTKEAGQSKLDAETTLAPVKSPAASFDKLIEDLPGLVTCHDANGDVMSVHGQSPEILSARASNLLGKGFVNQVHVSDRIRFMSAIDKLRQGVKCVCVDLRFETGFHNTASDLQFTHIQANLIGQFNHENDLEKFYIQSIDMTSLHNTKAWLNNTKPLNVMLRSTRPGS